MTAASPDETVAAPGRLAARLPSAARTVRDQTLAV